MLNLIAISIGQALVPLLLSTIITATLKKAGVLNHLYRLKMLIAYTLISCIGNMLIPAETWRIVLIGMTIVLLIGAFLSLTFYLYVLIRSRRK
jgi:hypothetical protein